MAELLHSLIPLMDELGIPHRWKVVLLDEASNLLAARLVDLLQGIEHRKNYLFPMMVLQYLKALTKAREMSRAGAHP